MSKTIQRRSFIKSSLAVACLAAVGCAALTGHGGGADREGRMRREFYDLRTYRIDTAEQQQRVSDYLQNALVPALNRMGSKPVGVFTVIGEDDDHSIYVLIPYASLFDFAHVEFRLADDEVYQQQAETYINTPADQPAFARIESRLMLAFAGIPKIELPAQTESNQPRIFELRLYESHSEEFGRRKMEMFNEGEIQIMRDTNLGPVFYGQTIIGTQMPNLVYMLSAENRRAHRQHWQVFGDHPEWDRMQGIERYKDTVSGITNIFLRPTAYSQI